MIGVYRRSAEKRGLRFLLTRAQCAKLFFSTCRYCGSDPNRHKIKGIPYNGIDRVDNSQGYVTKNVVTACGFCNQAKHGNSVQTFYEWIERISKHHGERDVSSKSFVQDTEQVSGGVEQKAERPKTAKRKWAGIR